MNLSLQIMSAIALLGAAPPSAADSAAAIDRFGPEAMRPSLCQPGSKTVTQAMPALSAFEAQWFVRQMEAAREPALYPKTGQTEPSHVYRFTWIPSFHPSVFVRLETSGSGSMRMVATRLSGAGGYEPGKVADQIDRPLTAGEQAHIESLLQRLQPMQLASPDCSGPGIDGAAWLFEDRENGRYRFIRRWSPRTGPVRDLGDAFLDLTGWTFEARY